MLYWPTQQRSPLLTPIADQIKFYGFSYVYIIL